MSKLSAMPLRRNSRKTAAKTPRGLRDTERAYERIWSAIMEHSLPPGTRLVEDKLCEIFGIGRTRIRQVLQRLAHEGVVTLMPNRGAMVAEPTVQEARDIFEARCILEAGIVTQCLKRATRADLRRLREHLMQEKQAWREADRRTMLKLSGEFHLVIAELAGNHTLTSLLRELVSRSSLIIAVYDRPGAAPCPPDEHQALCAALERGDPNAVTLMQEHLRHVLEGLNLVEHHDEGVDLKSVFADVA
ncbi:DNA-binding transcriptional regulator, GntR family [Solimonas aquatica]|uniref:DNA-binding transcriptional regulator, GntR family n=1 Tax=Solimonas aquatica TaxID=489703 RepID=A0A1H9IFN4_9GAMM|nr:GntR family transcriptional regulator [Solimonas aquatica]SEQ73403.1 DNA-binding transcriptional regulator, GntR family [Solimonas aquatica]